MLARSATRRTVAQAAARRGASTEAAGPMSAASVARRLRKAAKWEGGERPADGGKKYRVLSGVVVERLPRVLPEVDPAVARYRDAQHVLRANNLSRRPTVPAKMLENDTTVPVATAAAAVDEEKAAFRKEPLPRVTEDDAANNRRSTNRRLDRRLFLLVKKDRAEHAWQFPQGAVGAEETLRAAGERELAEGTSFGNNEQVYFLSNAPAGHLRYDYAAPAGGFDGAKVFFLPAMYLDGEPQLKADGVVDYAWAAKDELGEYLDESLLGLAEEMLMD